jgi:hypothetical protein
MHCADYTVMEVLNVNVTCYFIGLFYILQARACLCVKLNFAVSRNIVHCTVYGRHLDV